MGEGGGWRLWEVRELFEKGLVDVVFEGEEVDGEDLDGGEVEVRRLVWIKRGGCGEDWK